VKRLLAVIVMMSLAGCMDMEGEEVGSSSEPILDENGNPIPEQAEIPIEDYPYAIRECMRDCRLEERQKHDICISVYGYSTLGYYCTQAAYGERDSCERECGAPGPLNPDDACRLIPQLPCR